MQDAPLQAPPLIQKAVGVAAAAASSEANKTWSDASPRRAQARDEETRQRAVLEAESAVKWRFVILPHKINASLSHSLSLVLPHSHKEATEFANGPDTAHATVSRFMGK